MMRSTPAAARLSALRLNRARAFASGHSCCFEVRSLPATTGRMVDIEPATATRWPRAAFLAIATAARSISSSSSSRPSALNSRAEVAKVLAMMMSAPALM